MRREVLYTSIRNYYDVLESAKGLIGQIWFENVNYVSEKKKGEMLFIITCPFQLNLNFFQMGLFMLGYFRYHIFVSACEVHFVDLPGISYVQ